MKTLFSSLLLIFANSVAQAANSPLPFSLIETYFKPVKCFEVNVDLAFSCAEGFNAAGELSPDRLKLIAKTQFQESRFVVKQDWGPLLLVSEKSKIAPPTYQEFLQNRDQSRAQLKQAVAQLHEKVRAGATPPFDYREQLKALTAKSATEKVVIAALNGQLQSSDPHGFIMSRPDYELLQGSSNPEIVGVGVVLHPANQGYRFQHVVKGSAADEAGLKDRDLLISINDEKIGYDLSSEEVVRRLQGPKGSQVKVVVRRIHKIREFRITRRAFTLQNLESRYFKEQKTGYLKIHRFTQTGDAETGVLGLCEEARQLLYDMQQDGAENWIVDVRDNPGGFIDQAICLLSLFTGPDKVAVQMKSPGIGSRMQVEKTKEALMFSGPLVILQNEASASASELLAGAVQDLERGWIVGTRSFGKGSLQQINEFIDAPLAAIQANTIQLFYQPRGRTNQGEGIYSDVEVFFSPADVTEWFPREFDIYPEALKAKPQVWTSPRPEAQAQLKNCVKIKSEKGYPTGDDPQLAAAHLALSCSNAN